jgi:hypothetical protein
MFKIWVIAYEATFGMNVGVQLSDDWAIDHISIYDHIRPCTACVKSVPISLEAISTCSRALVQNF